MVDSILQNFPVIVRQIGRSGGAKYNKFRHFAILVQHFLTRNAPNINLATCNVSELRTHSVPSVTVIHQTSCIHTTAARQKHVLLPSEKLKKNHILKFVLFAITPIEGVAKKQFCSS